MAAKRRPASEPSNHPARNDNLGNSREQAEKQPRRGNLAKNASFERTDNVLFDYGNTGLDEFIDRAPDFRELIGQPGRHRNGPERQNPEPEVPAQFVLGGTGNSAENGMAVHLREYPYNSQAKEE